MRSVFFSAKIQQDMTHSSEGETNLGFSFFFIFFCSLGFFFSGIIFSKRMKQRGWFHPLRGGSFSAEFQQEIQFSQVVFSLRSVFFSAEIQRKKNHPSEGETNLGFLFYEKYFFLLDFFFEILFFEKVSFPEVGFTL